MILRKIVILALGALLLAGAAVADDDCILLPEDRVSGEIVFELEPGSDPAQFVAYYGCTGLDWIAEISVGRTDAPAGSDAAAIDALTDRMEHDRSDLDLRLDRGAAFECLDADAHRLLEDPEGVQQALGDLLPILSRQDYTNQSAATLTRVPQATASFTGAGVTIAVLDTGIAPANAELAPFLTGSGISTIPGETSADVAPNGVDDDGDGSVDEAAGHGVHVAGLVHLAAPEAAIMPIRVLDDDGKGTSFTVARGIIAAADAGADIINLSLGLPHDTRPVEAAIEHAAAKGTIVVAAGGNRGLTCVDFPADRPDAVAVAAVDDSFQKPAWASCGVEIALSAPGVQTISTHDDASWSRWDGSSFATPLVTGGAALLKQRFPGIAPDDLKSTLQLCVQPDAITDPAIIGRMGTGVLDLGNIATVEIAGTMRIRRDRVSGSDEITWSPVPGGRPVDLARGLVSALSFDDENVFLGTLTCIADDVPAGTPIVDPSAPPPGDAWFYVLRDDDPDPARVGSWGHGSGNRERLASSGNCNP